MPAGTHKRLPWLWLALAGALAAGLMGFAPRADAYVYWTNAFGDSIGRANLEGGDVDMGFIDATRPRGVAVDGSHVYWAEYSLSGGSIGRADLDGGDADPTFIMGTTDPCGVAVDDQHLYWTNASRNPPTIGRARLDGTKVRQSFITGVGSPCGLAVDHAHVYWTDTEANAIGRANLDGTQAQGTFVSTAGSPCGVAVDDAHLYWDNQLVPDPTAPNAPGTTIGRANLDGTGVDQSFIGGANRPCGVAVDSQHVYWGSINSGMRGDGTIGRADLDGSNPDQSFVTGASRPVGVAVDAESPATEIFDLGRVIRHRRSGTAALVVRVPQDGRLKLSGREVRHAGREVAGPAKRKLRIRARRGARKRLRADGRVRVRARVVYQPEGGGREVRTTSFTLVKQG